MRQILWIWLVLPLFGSQSLLAGASCVVAKKLGNSLAIDWVASAEESAASATEKAQEKLRKQGLHKKYQDIHPQANTELPHAHLVIVKTAYTTVRGKPRTSYGCGFSARSVTEAGQAALYNLQNYSWGWKPEMGYEVVEQLKY